MLAGSGYNPSGTCNTPPHPWARVKGFMGATQMHLMEMGWEIQFAQGKVRLRDDKGDIWQPNPQHRMGLLRS
eukprot:11731971-Karenia_brevis.AAC.1